MEPSQVRRALQAARLTTGQLGLQTNQAVVIHNSDRIVVRLTPGDVLARIAARAWEDDLRFEAQVARRLAENDSPVGALEPRAGAGVYLHDSFVLTLWTYYEQVGEIAPADYADALHRIHAGLRQIDLVAPHISERIAAWKTEAGNREQNPELPDPDRQCLRSTFDGIRNALDRWNTSDQLLHGEPHPGNLLSTSRGPLFIDLHTCQRGPVEYDIAFIPEEAAALYSGADPILVQQFRILMWAGFTTMRWRAWDQFPNRDYWRVEGFKRLRAALDRA